MYLRLILMNEKTEKQAFHNLYQAAMPKSSILMDLYLNTPNLYTGKQPISSFIKVWCRLSSREIIET